MLGNDSGIVSPLPSLPKPNASNMHITSVGTKTEDPKPQWPRSWLFWCVLPAISPAQLSSTGRPKQECQRSPADHIYSNRKRITNISNMALKTLCMQLSEKFCSLSSDRRNSASRQAHLRIWHFLWDLRNKKFEFQQNCTACTSKSVCHRPHQPHSAWPWP